MRIYLFLRNTKLPKQLFGILEGQSSQIGVCPCHSLLRWLRLTVVLREDRHEEAETGGGVGVGGHKEADDSSCQDSRELHV